MRDFSKDILTHGTVKNLGMDLTAGVFSITQADGTALGTGKDSGLVVMPSITAGRTVALEVNSNVSFNDNGHASPSFPTNMGLGITTSVAWANDMPIFLYAVNEDDTSANLGFFFSRSPTLKTTPVAGLIHDFTALGATADSQDHIALIGADDAGKASKPCMLIGSFKMTYTIGATNGYVITALDNSDGIGKFQQGEIFTFPTGQMGATSGTHCIANGGTAPTYTVTDELLYTLSMNGQIDVSFNYHNNTGGTPGAGTGNLSSALPYSGAGPLRSYGIGHISEGGGTTSLVSLENRAGWSYFIVLDTIVTTLVQTDQDAASRQLRGTISYKAF